MVVYRIKTKGPVTIVARNDPNPNNKSKVTLFSWYIIQYLDLYNQRQQINFTIHNNKMKNKKKHKSVKTMIFWCLTSLANAF
jgi:hypothetical protein